MIKKNMMIVAFAAASTLMACSSAKEEKPVAAQKDSPTATTTADMPAFALQDMAGNAVNLQSMKGKKVFVNLWASWCPPCREEMPSIEKLYASVDKDKVAFVMLSYDDDPEASRKFVKSNSLSLPVYFPAEQPPVIFQTGGIPATFIFNESGELVKQNTGADDYDTDAYRQLLQ